MTPADLRAMKQNARLEPFYDDGKPVSGFSWYHEQIKEYTCNVEQNTFYITLKRA
jgi:hypothetical protein